MDYKRVLTQLERTLGQIENAGNRRLTVEQIAETIAANFRDELGITGGRIYEETGEDTYELVGRFGQSGDAPLGIVVPKDYKPIELVLENGIVVMDPDDPGVDPVLEEKLGSHRFAAIAAGEDYAHILGFDVSPQLSREDILFSLNVVRYAVNQRLRAERFESLIVEAQQIQQSILPPPLPREGPAAHIDLTPTLLEACRVEPPAKVKFDGRSLLGVALGVTDGSRPALFAYAIVS